MQTKIRVRSARILVTLATIWLAALTIATTASAQFHTLDRQGRKTKLDARANFVVPDSGSGFLVRTDLYGQFSISSFGIYGALPISKAVDTLGNDSALGNFEFGGIYSLGGDGPFSLVSHIGLSVPTADDSLSGALVNLTAHTTRVNEFYVAAVPDQTTLRLATSPILDLGIVFLRGDLGFDFAFPDVGDNRTIIRGNVGAGLNILLVTITGELANTGWVNAPASFTGDTWLHSASLGLSLNTPIVQPFVVFTSPLNDGLRGEIYEGTVGVKIEF